MGGEKPLLSVSMNHYIADFGDLRLLKLNELQGYRLHNLYINT